MLTRGKAPNMGNVEDSVKKGTKFPLTNDYKRFFGHAGS